MNRYLNYLSGLAISAMLFVACEGPMGPNGNDGADANETCKKCHNPNVVEAMATQYHLSKHSWGEAAFEEAGASVNCTPCHESEAFKYVSANSIPSTFALGTNGKYTNSYAATSTTGYGEITCNTCHSSLHTTYDSTDFYPLTTTAPVAMTMWGGSKTINLTQGGGTSNLCVKCHQPRPLTTSSSLSDGNIVDYADLIANPTAVYYDSAVGNKAPNKLTPSYRTHVHYGGVGAIFAGVGGIEFPGTLAYTSSSHTTTASCSSCHMAEMNNASGGHTFKAIGNFKGCNVSGCHDASPLSSTSTKFTDTRTTIKTLLETLASKLTSGGVEMLHTNSDSEENLWYSVTSKHYDGYLNIYDPSTNPEGVFRNPAPSNSWTTEQKNTNNALPKFTSLKNVQVGALINFQLCLREYSLGVHNYNYSRALLQNTIEALTAAGF
jgi:hypothetical protein